MNPDSQQPAAPAPVPSAPQPSTPTPVTPSPAPNPTFTPTAGDATPPVTTGKKKLSKNMMMAIVAVAVLVVAGIAYGVYAYVSNLPENLMQSAIENIKNEKSLAANFKVVSGTDANGVTVSGDAAYAIDPTNSKNGELIFGLGTNDKRVAINALALDNTLFLKLTNMENLGALLGTFSSDIAAANTPALATALKNVNNQWFELTKDDVKSLAQSSGNDSIAGAVSPDDLKQVLTIYNQHPFVKTDKTYPDEVIDGSNSAHFSVKPDKNETIAFLQALKAANLSTIKVTDADITDEKNANYDNNAPLDVWIARDTKKFKQLRIVDTTKGSEMAVTITLSSKLPTFDKFQKPADVKPMSDFTTLLLGSNALMY
jgi:hypothetical protein